MPESIQVHFGVNGPVFHIGFSVEGRTGLDTPVFSWHMCAHRGLGQGSGNVLSHHGDENGISICRWGYLRESLDLLTDPILCSWLSLNYGPEKDAW